MNKLYLIVLTILGFSMVYFRTHIAFILFDEATVLVCGLIVIVSSMMELLAKSIVEDY